MVTERLLLEMGDTGTWSCNSRKADRKTVRRDEKYDGTRSETVVIKPTLKADQEDIRRCICTADHRCYVNASKKQ